VIRSASPASEDSPGPNGLGRLSPNADFPISGWRPRGRIAKTASSEILLLENSQGRQVVGKRLLPALACRRPCLLENEYAALTRFADLGVVRVLGLTDHGSESWLLLEHLRYGDLRSLAGAPMACWLPLLLEPVRWLANLHAEGFVYGDLKTSHLMLRHPSQACFIDLATITALGQPVSAQTRAAAPPEAVVDASFSADVFAFGVMLHELLFAGLPAPRGQWSSGDQHGCPQLVRLSATCRAPDPSDRPSMQTVFRRLRELNNSVTIAETALP
jgi:serine/threonine protein kinase